MKRLLFLSAFLIVGCAKQPATHPAVAITVSTESLTEYLDRRDAAGPADEKARWEWEQKNAGVRVRWEGYVISRTRDAYYVNPTKEDKRNVQVFFMPPMEFERFLPNGTHIRFTGIVGGDLPLGSLSMRADSLEVLERVKE